MGLFDLATAAEALEELYDRERTAILAGRFDVLDRLVAEKERLLASLARRGAAEPAMANLRRLADRNGGLLRAMEGGVRAAMRRIEAIRQGPAALQTYDSSGQLQAAVGSPTSLHRRA